MRTLMEPLKQVAQIYDEHFKTFGISLDAVECPKPEQMPVRFDALLRHMPIAPGDTMLDYGCGLAYLLGHLRERRIDVAYTGVDIAAEFIASDRDRFRDVPFELIGGPADVDADYDHVVLSGVFGIRYVESFDAHFDIVKRTLTQLFARTRKSLSVNFMTHLVDFMQLRAFHLDPTECCRFVQNELSRRLVCDQSYMPFEYTVTVMRDTSFTSPQYIYATGAGSSSAPNGRTK